MEKNELLERRLFSPVILNELSKLKKKNNWYNWFSISLDWAVILLLIVINQYVSSLLLYVASVILIGGRMRGLDNLMHEASHYMLFKNRNLNRWVANLLLGFPVFATFTLYRLDHYRHHKYLWTDKDPDTTRLKKMGLAGNVQLHMFSFFIRYLCKVYVASQLFNSIWTITKSLFVPGKQNKAEFIGKLVFWVLVTFLAVWIKFWDELILYYIFPLLTVFQFIRIWSDVSDHSGLESNTEMFSSRNSYGSFLERFILYPHNDSYHIVHHLFPSIPHFNLYDAHLVLLADPDYRQAHHCAGTFTKLLPGIPTVMEDIAGQRRPFLLDKD